jgi:murein DD-endopeptidase MepM/ murein hydrolase activator NlpD
MCNFKGTQFTRGHFLSGRNLLLIICLVFCAGFALDINHYPQDYFASPLSRQILLSGTFGELRSNHFHAGLDIKSKDGSTGEQILASAPGFISRINIQSGGYGNVLYIDHPNGYTTVYAHLDRFIPEVAAYVKSMQYTLKRFDVELYPRPDQFVFKKHQLIGYLGNTGSSSGPHLHFEIRKTSGQVPHNPLLFGIPVKDNRTPAIYALKVYHVDSDLRKTKEFTYTPVSAGSGRYRINDTLTLQTHRVGFALKAFDQMDGASNQNGIYALGMSIDGQPQYRFELDAIPFSQTRYLNAHIDYAARQRGQGYYHHCFKLPGNALTIYNEQDGRGIVDLSYPQVHQIELTAGDYAGNTSSLTFFVRQDTLITETDDTGEYYGIDYLRSGQINIADCAIAFEPHTFYQNMQVSYARDASARPKLYAPVHTLGPDDTPVHRYFDMTLLSSGLPEHLRSKAFVAEVTDRGTLINLGGVAHGDHIFARVRKFGRFSVGIDTIPPEIIPITFRENMSGMSRMRFRIGDSQAVEGQASGLSFKATVDGEWILMEYEGKRAMLTHWFDDRIGPGSHELILKVWDDRGNERTLVRKFTR